ncbi:MAG: AbrB/MazE/SpoVT family DNA-binding domain-containing protein [Eubacteriales bacterium]
MKSTGITRPVDALGRIVIPMEIRNSFDINTKDLLEIYIQGDKIILRKHVGNCVFCDADEDLVDFEDKKICKTCLAKLSHLEEK